MVIYLRQSDSRKEGLNFEDEGHRGLTEVALRPVLLPRLEWKCIFAINQMLRRIEIHKR